MSKSSIISGWVNSMGKKASCSKCDDIYCEDECKGDPKSETKGEAAAKEIKDPKLNLKKKKDEAIVSIEKKDPSPDEVDGIAKQSAWQRILHTAKEDRDIPVTQTDEEVFEAIEKQAGAIRDLWFTISGIDKSASFADRINRQDIGYIVKSASAHIVAKQECGEELTETEQELDKQAAALWKSLKSMGRGAVAGARGGRGVRGRVRGLFSGAAQGRKGQLDLPTLSKDYKAGLPGGGLPTPGSATPAVIPTPYATATQGPGMLAAPGKSSPTSAVDDLLSKYTLGGGTASAKAIPAAAKGLGWKRQLGLTGGASALTYFGGRGVGRGQGMETGYNAAEHYFTNAAKDTGIWDRILQLFTGQKFSKEQLAAGRAGMKENTSELFDKFYNSNKSK